MCYVELNMQERKDRDFFLVLWLVIELGWLGVLTGERGWSPFVARFRDPHDWNIQDPH